MRTHRMPALALPAAVILAAGWVALAGDRPPTGDHERTVTAAEVPRPALDALKKLAGDAAITEFAEEVEHGCKYYEGTWAGPHGKIDGLVTEAGDVVETEEAVPSRLVPAAARAAAEKIAGTGAEMKWEKKTLVMYEVHFRKDGHGHEHIFLPDGRRFHEPAAGPGEADKDKDD